MKIIALTTPNCTKCKSVIPRVKELCEENNVPLFIQDAMTEGRALVNHYKVTSVPTFLVYDELDALLSLLVGEEAYHDIKSLM